MTQPTLELVSAVAGRISLDEYLLGAEEGFQVLSGATGFGLPKKESRWFEGAGDGATYRGERTLARDMDLPFLIEGGDRAGLKRQTKRLSLALSGPFDLEWIEDGIKWVLRDCRHVSGGDFMYGADTVGERDLFVIVTIRAGQPYWERDTGQSMTCTPGVVSVNDVGTAPTPPVWTITGPCTKFTVTSPEGRKLGWTGNLITASTLTIDTFTGLTTKTGGGNGYSELDDAPKFWYFPGGPFEFYLEFTGLGSVKVDWTPRSRMVI